MDNLEMSLSVKCCFAFRNIHSKNVSKPYPHSHPCTEIVYFGGSSGWMYEDDRKWRYAPNQVAVYQPGTRHWTINDKDSFGYHLCLGTAGKESFLIPAKVYDANKNLILLFKLLENLLTMPMNRISQKTQLDLLANLICFSLRDLCMGGMERKKSSSSEIAKQIFDTEFMDQLTVDNLASRIYVSGDHLRHLFKKDYGVSPIQYLLRKRIEHAQGLLLNSDKKIYEISEDCGYDDPYYFSRIFKKISGKSPEQYRNEKKNSSS